MKPRLKKSRKSRDRKPANDAEALADGEAALASERFVQAIRYLGGISRDSPNYGRACKGHGAALVRVGRSAEALQILEVAHTALPNDPDILVDAGDAARSEGHLNIAEKAYAEARRLGADGFRIGFGEASFFQERKLLIAAIEQSLARVEERERRLLSEEELRETQERFRQLAEQSRDGFWFAALKPVRMLYVNPAMERIWGLPGSSHRQNSLAFGIDYKDSQERIKADGSELSSPLRYAPIKLDYNANAQTEDTSSTLALGGVFALRGLNRQTPDCPEAGPGAPVARTAERG